ncbi:ABC transporter transmembrane protein [Streptomyces sp. KS 21]|nr:ABC transporter transmembrane protein [Streptomyces sp. KS 21]
MNTASAPETTGAESLRVRETLKALYGYVRPHRWTVVLGLLLALAGSAGGLLQPLATKALVDRLSSGGTLGTVLLALTVLVLLSTVAEAFGAYVLERTAESVVLAARRSLIGRLLRLRLTAVDRMQPGDLMSRVTSDTTLLRAVSTQAVVNAATGALTLVAAVVVMAFLDAVLLGVTLAVVAVVGAGAALVMPKIGQAAERSQAAVSEMSTGLERVFGAFRRRPAPRSGRPHASRRRPGVRGATACAARSGRPCWEQRTTSPSSWRSSRCSRSAGRGCVRGHPRLHAHRLPAHRRSRGWRRRRCR